MSNLLVRSITGFFFGLTVIGSIILGTSIEAFVFGVFLLLGLWEYASFFKLTDYRQFQITSTITGIVIYSIGVIANKNLIPLNLAMSIVICIIFAYFLIELWRKQVQPLVTISIFIFGLFYLVIPFVLLNELSSSIENHFPVVIGMILLIWANDTFAYLFGRKLGKTPLFERISPNKTWEGTVAGIVMTLVTAGMIFYFSHSISLMYWIIAACIVAPCAIFGDLLESLFKRSLDIKDSGKILPGHGGILDRFDAVLFTVPFFYLWHHIYHFL